MTNFVSYVLLKWSYLWFFDRINSYFDESILLIMKVVALATGSLSVAAEIIWKVSAAVKRMTLTLFDGKFLSSRV